MFIDNCIGRILTLERGGFISHMWRGDVFMLAACIFIYSFMFCTTVCSWVYFCTQIFNRISRWPNTCFPGTGNKEHSRSNHKYCKCRKRFINLQMNRVNQCLFHCCLEKIWTNLARVFVLADLNTQTTYLCHYGSLGHHVARNRLMINWMCFNERFYIGTGIWFTTIQSK